MKVKILYLHALSSSGKEFSARMLERLMPESTVVSPDIPHDAFEALEMLRELCRVEQPDIVIGTSMGANFAQQMHGFPKILINPSFQTSAVMRKNLGYKPYMFPRKDGAKGFMITEEMAQQYEEMETRQFDLILPVDVEHTWAMFGRYDTMIDGSDVYKQHYDNFIMFEGEHMLNRDNVEYELIPLIKRVLS